MDQKFVKYLTDLPVNPEVAAKVLNIAEDKLDISFRSLEDIIKVDPGLTARVLKVANSALYARQKEISGLQQAITLLGFKNIKSLVLLVTASRFFQQARQTEFYRIFWRHSILTAFVGKSLALKGNRPELAETVFTAGLLHNIGRTVLFNADHALYAQVLQREAAGNQCCEDIEQELFGANHKTMGAELLRRWNFPDIFVDAAAEHDNLNITSPHKNVIILVTIAGIFADQLDAGAPCPARHELLQTLLLYTDLTPEDVKYFSTSYWKLLKQDRLFLEVQDLFELRNA